MAQNILLKRSAIAGKTPETSSLQLGELAINTYDGKIHFKKSGATESIEGIVTTNSQTTGSITLTDTGSFGSLKVNDTLTVNHGTTIISGSLGITTDLTVLGAVNARQFNISIISSSTIYESGSSNFGNSSDDTHSFTGSVDITGSLYVNGVEVGAEGGGSYTGSFTGSFFGDGSGLRGVVSDDLPIDGWDYDSNSSASISEFNSESKKYIIDFQWEEEVGTPIGFKTFISNVTGSSQIVPTEEGIKFIVGNELVATVGPEGINTTLPSGLVSSSAQLTDSLDTRYAKTGGSNTFSAYQTITDYVNVTGPTGGDYKISGTSIFNTTSTYIPKKKVTGGYQDSNISDNGSLVTINSNVSITNGSLTGEINATNGVVSGSSQITISDTTGYSTFSASIATRDINQDTNTNNISTSVANRLDVIETTFATTGSNTFNDTQVISASMYITGDLIVQGTSSIQNITASAVSIGTNVVYLNTNSPAVNYAGISVIDSGSSNATGSLFWDSTNNRWIYQKESGSTYSGGMLISGPRNLGGLGEEVGTLNNVITKGQGGDHITSSQITDDGTTVSIPGTLSASVFTGLGNVSSYSSSVASRIITIEGKYATTGSNTFVGNQIISGSIDINQKQNATSNFYIRNSDTTDASSRTYFNVNAGSTTISLLALNGGDTYIAGTSGKDMYFQQNPGGTVNMVISSTGVVRPGANGTQDLGSTSYRWANIYTNDLHLSNEGKVGGNDVDGTTGNWTLQEGEEHLYIINNKTGKKFKFSLEEIQ